MTRVPALQPAQGQQSTTSPTIAGPVRRRRQRLHPRAQPAGAPLAIPGPSPRPHCSKCRMGFTHILAGKSSALPRRRQHAVLYGIPGLPTSPDLTGGLNTQNISGFTAARTPGHQSAVPEPHLCGTPKVNYSWIRGRTRAEGRLRVRHHPHRGDGHQPGVRSERLRRAASANPRPAAPRRRRPATTWPISCSACPARSARQLPGRQLPAARVLPLRAGRFPGQLKADLEPRTALGIRHAALGARQRAVPTSIPPPTR